MSAAILRAKTVSRHFARQESNSARSGGTSDGVCSAMKQSDESKNPAPTPSRRVVDAPTRMSHVLLALCFMGAWITSESEHWRSLHVTIGYCMAGVLLFRLAYGLFGPVTARLSALFGRLGRLRSLVAQTRAWRQETTTTHPSLIGAFQNFLMAAAILAVLILSLFALASGYLTWNDAPKWMEELHEACGETLIALGTIHIALVLGFSLLRKRNLAMPMLSGKITGSGPDIITRNRTWLACLLLIVFCIFGVSIWQQISAQAASESARHSWAPERAYQTRV